MNVRGDFFGKFSMENWQALRSLKLQTSKDHARFMENMEHGSWRTFWAAGYAVLLFGKHLRTLEVKYRTHVEAGFEVYADHAVCNLFIQVI